MAGNLASWAASGRTLPPPVSLSLANLIPAKAEGLAISAVSRFERLRNGDMASDDGLVTLGLAILGPGLSTYDVTLTDLKLAREFGLCASMHVTGKQLVPDGFARLVAGPDTPIHCSASMEWTFVPGVERIVETIRSIVGYVKDYWSSSVQIFDAEFPERTAEVP